NEQPMEQPSMPIQPETQQYNDCYQPGQGGKLPGAVASMVLGIVSLVVSCSCIPLVGIIVGALGLSKAKKSFSLDEQYPEYYSGRGFATTGKVTSLVGLLLGIATTLFWAVYILGLMWLVEEGHNF
ncbi:MAG: DUF4190 domain-containing protein, partial [Bacteroidales bacterium]|nr:DUF4190 domain-containing protein [Bacteroidales bacterium]